MGTWTAAWAWLRRRRTTADVPVGPTYTTTYRARWRIGFPAEGGNWEGGYYDDDAGVLWHHVPHVGWRRRPTAFLRGANEHRRWPRRRAA